MPSILPCRHLDIVANTSLKTVESKLPTFIRKIGWKWNKTLVFLHLSELWTNPIKVNFSIFVVMWDNSVTIFWLHLHLYQFSKSTFNLSPFVRCICHHCHIGTSSKDCAQPIFDTLPQNINQQWCQLIPKLTSVLNRWSQTVPREAVTYWFTEIHAKKNNILQPSPLILSLKLQDSCLHLIHAAVGNIFAMMRIELLVFVTFLKV